VYLLAHAFDMSAPCRDAAIGLLIACGLVTAKYFTRKQLATTTRRVLEALCRVEKNFPASELDMKLHLLAHAPQQIITAGTMVTTALWKAESLWGTLVRMIGNQAHPEQDILHKVTDLESVNYLHVIDPDATGHARRGARPVRLTSKPPKPLRLPGRTATLVDRDVTPGMGARAGVLSWPQQFDIHNALTWYGVERYGQLWELFMPEFWDWW
jgi:hypothetical protein